MGRANAIAAYTLFPNLNHRAHRALDYMALVSLDPPGTDGNEPLRYYGGHAAIAAALGLVDWSAGQLDPKEHRSQAEVVRRVIKELTAAGAITTEVGGCRARAAEYRLHLDPLEQRNGGALNNVAAGHSQRHGGASPRCDGGAKRRKTHSTQREGERGTAPSCRTDRARDDEPMNYKLASQVVISALGSRSHDAVERRSRDRQISTRAAVLELAAGLKARSAA